MGFNSFSVGVVVPFLDSKTTTTVVTAWGACAEARTPCDTTSFISVSWLPLQQSYSSFSILHSVDLSIVPQSGTVPSSHNRRKFSTLRQTLLYVSLFDIFC